MSTLLPIADIRRWCWALTLNRCVDRLVSMTPINSRFVISHMRCWSRTSSLALELEEKPLNSRSAQMASNSTASSSSLMRCWLVRRDRGRGPSTAAHKPSAASTRHSKLERQQQSSRSPAADLGPLHDLHRRAPKEYRMALRFHRRPYRAQAFALSFAMPAPNAPSYYPPFALAA